MSKIKISNWNNYPKIDAEIIEPEINSVTDCLSKFPSLIARGAGKSYGDASLNEYILSTLKFNSILEMDLQNRTITVESGTLLINILDHIIPHGLFLPVVPGTKFITVGGAIASNIHGKNHSIRGSFSDWVLEMTILKETNEVVRTSRENASELFYSTFGAMGLTGVILSVKIKLIEIRSILIESEKKTFRDLENLLLTFNHSKSEFNVAWIDISSAKRGVVLSVFQSGDFSKEPLDSFSRTSKFISARKFFLFAKIHHFPVWLIHPFLVQIVNLIIYKKHQLLKPTETLHYDSFLFPLDCIEKWNRWYGPQGFIQYQFVLPLKTSFDGINEILKVINHSDCCVVLCILKKLGSCPECLPMSFPLEGFTLALDFKLTRGLFALLDQLDDLVIKYYGKVYLAKDARLNSQNFHSMYSASIKFSNYFKSLLSIRLKINASN